MDKKLNSKAGIAKTAYLPDNWNDDAEMSGLMSYLKARHVNPINYDRVIEFWKNVINDYCHYQKKCIFTLEELKIKFKRGTQLPSPLPTVLEELRNSGIIFLEHDYKRQTQTWLNWGVSLLKPTGWMQSIVSSESNVNQSRLIHIPVLKEQAREVLLFYRNNYEMMDCPDVLDYNDFMAQTSHIISQNCFELVINELVRMGEVSIGFSKDGDKVLKFKDQSAKGPARFTESDANVHDIHRTMNRLDLDIKRAEQREKMLKEEARAALSNKDKKSAMNIMRKVARVRKDIQDKDVQYQRLLSIVEQLAASKQTKEIIDVYKAGTMVFKETLTRQGLTPEKVDTTMDTVLETMQDFRDVEEALRDGFRHLPQAAADSIDEAELESELNELIREGVAEEERQKPPAAEVAQPAAVIKVENRVRVGKRVLDLNDLPEVPNSSLGNWPSTSSSTENNHTNVSLEERWKRLRMHAT